MENQVKMASEAQINYLRKLGYQGSTANLTNEQASNLIKSYSNRGAQEQPQQNYGGYNPQYGSPAQEQYGAPNPTATNPQPSATPQHELSVSNGTDYSIMTKSGEILDLSPETVKAYICDNLTPVEFNYFFSVCKAYELNPFLKDIYAIKFGNQPATFVIDYKVMQQAADNNPTFDGLKVGIVYLDKNGIAQEREGAYILPGETLVAGWCDVFRKDRTHANRTYALYSENVKLTKEGNPNTNWANKPVFMIVKVAKAQALRETFPNMFSNNTYVNEEFDESNIINEEASEVTTEAVNKKQKEKTASKKIEAPTPEKNTSEEWPD